MSDETKQRYQCPKCGLLDTLWEAVVVQGWRSINARLEPEGERDVDWYHAEKDDWASPAVGCGECQWEGERTELVKIGIDGEPLRVVHPDQLEIEEAA